METLKIDWDRIRRDYPGLEGKTYLDTSAMGLIARPTAEAGQRVQEEVMGQGSLRGIWWQMEGRRQVGAEVAAQLGGDPAGTVLFQSFTAGLTRLAPLLKHRGKVVLFEGDYPTLHGPFTWNGFGTVMVRPAADGSIPLDALEEVLRREKPGLVAISHVQWLTGSMVHLKAFGELCRKYGAWSVVDITQSWCLVPIDLRHLSIDIIGSSGYKWPLAGFGNGFFHLAEGVREELHREHGFSVVQALGEGHMDPVALVRLSHALQRSNSWGVETAFGRVKELCDRAVVKIQSAGIRVLHGTDAGHRAGILILEGDKVRQQYLEQHGCPTQLRGAGLRIGIHFYNNEADVDRFVEVLATS